MGAAYNAACLSEQRAATDNPLHATAARLPQAVSGLHMWSVQAPGPHQPQHHQEHVLLYEIDRSLYFQLATCFSSSLFLSRSSFPQHAKCKPVHIKTSLIPRASISNGCLSVTLGKVVVVLSLTGGGVHRLKLDVDGGWMRLFNKWLMFWVRPHVKNRNNAECPLCPF